MMDQFLTENKGLFIVRSTGKEDSDEQSNAGGNESIQFVRGEERAISKAIGQVVKSYFGEKSIRQRLLAGDSSLFFEAPLIPVLIQSQVMEDEGGGSFRSGVIFSRPEKDLPGLVRIQTGLGNNHGIVNCKVAVDSYDVMGKDVMSVIRAKKDRYIHKETLSGEFELIKVDNSEELVKQPALSSGLARDLALMATTIASSPVHGEGEKKSMDMEYSIKTEIDPETNVRKNVIYLLQARPLRDFLFEQDPPGYLNPAIISQASKDDVVNGKTLLFAGSSVREVASGKKMLFADDLPTALKQYDSSITGVVVNKTAPLTSHEGVMFRHYGLPVFVIENKDDYERAKRLVLSASEEHPVLLSPQNREIIVSTRGLSPEQREAMKAAGRITFPGALEASVRVDKALRVAANLLNPMDKIGKVEGRHLSIEEKELLLNKYLERQNDQLKRISETLLKRREPLSISGKIVFFSIQDFIVEIATGETKDAELALEALLRTLGVMLNWSLTSLKKDSSTVEKLAVFEMIATFSAVLEQAEERLIPALTSPPGSLERLVHLKTLEAFVFQPESKDIVNGFSFVNSLSVIKRVKALPQRLTYDMQVLTLYKRAGLSLEAGGRWERFIKDLRLDSQESISKLRERVAELDELNMTSLWMSLTFSGRFSEYSAVELFQFIEEQFKRNALAFAWIKGAMGRVVQYEKTVEKWADPKFYRGNLEELITDFKGWFDPKDNPLIKQQYEQARTLGKLAILQFLERSVNAFDTIIKTVKGSENFDDQQKIQAFVYLLAMYETMMESTFSLMDKDSQTACFGTRWNASKGLTMYFKGILDGYKYSLGEVEYDSIGFSTIKDDVAAGVLSLKDIQKQFTARPEFNVQPLLAGGLLDLTLGVVWPDRLEEYFTVFHQNIETVKAMLVKKNGIDKSLFSPRAQQIVGLILEKITNNLSAVELKDKKVEVRFNISLQQHAAAISLVYDPKNPDAGVDLTVAAFGNDESNRWDYVGTALALIGQQPDLSLKASPEFDYMIDKESKEFLGIRGVKAVIHVDQSFRQLDPLIGGLDTVLRSFTLWTEGHSSEIVTQLNEIIKELNPAMEISIEPDRGLSLWDAKKKESSISVNNYLMRESLKSALDTSLNQANRSVAISEAMTTALSTIKGMASRKIPKDYKLRDAYAENCYQSSYKDYGILERKSDVLGYSTDKPLIGAEACLMELLDRDLISGDDLQELFADKVVERQFPEVLERLREAVAKKPREETL